MSEPGQSAAGGDASTAVVDYAVRHRTEQVALPVLVDAVAEKSGTSAQTAKRAIFGFMDQGRAHFTTDFMIAFADA